MSSKNTNVATVISDRFLPKALGKTPVQCATVECHNNLGARRLYHNRTYCHACTFKCAECGKKISPDEAGDGSYDNQCRTHSMCQHCEYYMSEDDCECNYRPSMRDAVNARRRAQVSKNDPDSDPDSDLDPDHDIRRAELLRALATKCSIVMSKRECDARALERDVPECERESE